MKSSSRNLGSGVIPVDSQGKSCLQLKKQPFQRQQHLVSYAALLWGSFIFFTVFSAIERLTLNVWSLGVDNKFPHEAVWGVQVFEVFSYSSFVIDHC